MKYPKIQTLWKRDENGKIKEGEFSKDEFTLTDYWFLTEKLHGQNCRILVNFDEGNVKGKYYEHEGLFIQGRTNKAEQKLAKSLLRTYQALNKGNLLSARVNFSQVLESLDEDSYCLLEKLAEENDIDLKTLSEKIKEGVRK